MPYFFDLVRPTTSNVAAGTETTHMWVKTAANQETLGIYGTYGASRFLTAGGGQIHVKDNTGTTASGGTAQTPTPKNRRGSAAAQSVWANDASAITAGATNRWYGRDRSNPAHRCNPGDAKCYQSRRS